MDLNVTSNKHWPISIVIIFYVYTNVTPLRDQTINICTNAIFS